MRTRDVGAPSGVGPLPHKYRRSPLQRRTFLTLVGSYTLLVTPGEAWYIPYISTGETRTANRERLPRVHASTVPADQRRAAPHPMPRCAPGILTRADTPTAAVWTVRLRGLGCGVGLCRRTLVWSLCLPLAGSPQEAVAEQIEVRPPKHLTFHHFQAVDVPLDRAGRMNCQLHPMTRMGSLSSRSPIPSIPSLASSFPS